MDDEPFIIEPSIQPADAAVISPASVVVTWQSADFDLKWKVKVRRNPLDSWTAVEPVSFERIDDDEQPRRIYRAEIHQLQPGGSFDYRVMLDTTTVHEARGCTPRTG